MKERLDQLLESLRSVGEYDSSGNFLVDLGRALEKLRLHQSDRPGHYTLLLSAGACRLGARRLAIRETTSRFELSWPGVAAALQADPREASRQELLGLAEGSFPEQGLHSPLCLGLSLLARGFVNEALEPLHQAVGALFGPPRAFALDTLARARVLLQAVDEALATRAWLPVLWEAEGV